MASGGVFILVNCFYQTVSLHLRHKSYHVQGCLVCLQEAISSPTYSDPITHSCQAGPGWNFIRDVLPVDMTNSRTWDIKHFSSTHPNLKKGNLKV